MQRCSVSVLIKTVAKYKRQLVIAQVIALISTLLTVVIPLFIPLLVDELLLGKSHGFTEMLRKYLYPFSTEGVVFFVLAFTLLLRYIAVLAGVWQVRIFTRISKTVSFALRQKLLEHLRRVSLKAYETLRSGAVASRLVTDVETLDAFISVTVSKLILSVLILLFSAVVLLWIDWKLGVFILLTNPVVVFFTAKMARKTGRLKRQENQAVEEFQSVLVETLELMHQIRASGKESYFFQKVRNKAAELKDKAALFSYKSDAAQKYSYLIFLSGYELFRAVSILAVSYGELSVGLMLAIFSYLWVMVSPTQDLIGFYYAWHNAKAACERIDTVFSMPCEPQYEEKCNPFKQNASVGIRLEGVDFSYDDKKVLENLHMHIKSGAKVAIVGPSGSGKTTLANLLVGFYEPDGGEIYYDACERKHIGLQTIRKNVHLILQHPKLFNATMRFNLTLGEHYDEARINEALRIARLDEVVARLENGLETRVGRDGVKLSGGQRQRVAIARMVLADPKVIVMDESTSALDVHTEAALFAELEKFWKNKTVITIAHRLSTIERAEYIFVLEDGRLADAGTPEQLRKRAQGYFSGMI
jgi:ATP-binding cassette subfamily C protein